MASFARISKRFHSPDGREIKISIEPQGWLVLVEHDPRDHRSTDVQHALALALGRPEHDPWIVATSDQIRAAFHATF